MKEEELDLVLGRLYNWKFKDAWEYARNIADFPTEAIELLERIANQYGNCGWQSSVEFSNLSKETDKLVEMLGYEFVDNGNLWEKIMQ